MQNLIQQNFHEMQQVLNQFACEENFLKIQQAADLMSEALTRGNAIFSCGNGGSMCDAMHFAEELTGRFRENRPALKAVAIADPSHLSCVSNDYGYDFVFSRYLEAWAKKGDVLLAISTSGNSKNVLQAIEMAKSKEMIVIGLTGKDGGKMANLSDVEIRVKHVGYADRIQEIHIKVIHTFIQLIEEKLF
jgi:D-sedoheptulose 7-phosphate isomerase